MAAETAVAVKTPGVDIGEDDILRGNLFFIEIFQQVVGSGFKNDLIRPKRLIAGVIFLVHAPVSIDLVSQNRKPRAGQMRPRLMRPRRHQLHIQKRKLPVGFHQGIPRGNRSGVFSRAVKHLPPAAIHSHIVVECGLAVPSDGAADHRLIEPADAALLERLKQLFKIQLVLGDDDQAAGIDIQSVADIGHA